MVSVTREVTVTRDVRDRLERFVESQQGERLSPPELAVADAVVDIAGLVKEWDDSEDTEVRV